MNVLLLLYDMKKLILLFFPLYMASQDVSIGSWKNYLSYNSAAHISEANNKIYCVASEGLFYINKEDFSINRLSKINGLSDLEIKYVAFANDDDITIVVYKNCNIDLIKNGQIINISDIKRKEITGVKEIYNITIKEKILYLSCSFGLVLVDLEREEIKDTYNIGNINGMFEVRGCAFLGDSIIAATSNGVFYADVNSMSLSDFNSWNVFPGFSNSVNYDNIICANETIYVDTTDEIKSISYNNKLIKTFVDKIEVVGENNVAAEIKSPLFSNVMFAINDNENNLWVADSINGLLRFNNNTFIESFVPQGPKRNEVYSLNFAGGKLYQCHGGHANFGANALINDGVSIKDEYDSWVNYDRYKLGNARDILEVGVWGGVEYYASWYHGISEVKNGELVVKHGHANTNGALDTTYYSNNRIRISDIKFDQNGTLWALSSEVNHPIVAKTINDQWFSYTMNQNQVDLFFDDLLIDQSGNKWGVIARGGGLFVYNDNSTLSNNEDDQYKILNTNIGSGKLPSMQTYSLAEDLEGAVWVGTDKGVAVFYNPDLIFSNFNYDAQQILITEGNYGQYLLSEERVKCISIDGANRKWIGTEKSGVFLLSKDGQEEVLHFTKNNSPLFSNNIVDIAIDPQNGEVFIATDKGLMSYRSDATEGSSKQGKTKVFPNPVRENYNGPIAISGLVTDAKVKITDVTGELVFETIANGGQAIWSGKNKFNERVATGVYLVFSTNAFGEKKMVSKILFIK